MGDVEYINLCRLVSRTEAMLVDLPANVLVGDSLQRQTVVGSIRVAKHMLENVRAKKIIASAELEPCAVRIHHLESTVDIGGLADTDIVPNAFIDAPAAQRALRARSRHVLQNAKKKELLQTTDTAVGGAGVVADHSNEGELALMTKEEYDRRRREAAEEPQDGAFADGVAPTWEEMLEWHQREQEAMAEEMESNSVLMRQAAQQINDTLTQDVDTLDEVTQKTDQNIAAVGRESERIRRQIKSTCSFTWISLALCALMFVIFAGCVMFMKMFSKSVH